MTKESVRYLCISDIHFGHRRTKTSEIIKALDTFFNNYQPRKDLDIIFLAGDVFDQLLDLPSPEVGDVTIWISRFVDYCSRNQIKLRILEGTPSHDWGQSNLFIRIAKAMGSPVDIAYVNTLHIELMTDLGISILYVPDEWNANTDKTAEQAEELITSMGLIQVDIAICHGQFAYQLPSAAMRAPRHNEDRYLAMVKHFISIGHVHIHSIYERILAQGSFDRLAMGEESPKGGMECVIHSDGSHEYYFIENKLAKIYNTLTIKTKDIDSTISFIERKVKGLPIDSYIRIRANKDHPAIIGFDELRKRFPLLVLSKITIEEEKEQQSHELIDEVSDEETTYVPITITKDNIKALLSDELRAKYSLEPKQWDIVDKAFSEVL